jgi:hypothetical protein
MAQIYENRQAEIRALKRQVEDLKSKYLELYGLFEESPIHVANMQKLAKDWQTIAERAIYELNKTPAWMHLTHEDIETVLRQMENLEAPYA